MELAVKIAQSCQPCTNYTHRYVENSADVGKAHRRKVRAEQYTGDKRLCFLVVKSNKSNKIQA